MRSVIPFFAQAVTFRPQDWTTAEQIHHQFDHEGYRSSFLTSLVSYAMALHDILFLWRRRVMGSQIRSLHTRSMNDCTLSLLSRGRSTIVDSLTQRQRFFNQAANNVGFASGDFSW